MTGWKNTRAVKVNVMTEQQYHTLAFWKATLKEVAKEYPGNINLGTIVKSIESRINFYNKERK